MKLKFCALFMLVFFAFQALAQDCARLAEALYPESRPEQALVKDFLAIVQQHKNGNDPLLGGVGPGIQSFQIDKMKFAFLTNLKADSVDLVIFNWDLEVFPGLENDEALSRLYGKPIYVLRNLDPKTIGTQGDDGDLLVNFSYILGARSQEASMQAKYPGMTIPDSIINWKPHPGYMDKTHPLRKALDVQELVLLSPQEELWYKQMGDMPEEAVSWVRNGMDSKGGFNKVMNAVFVHEMFHVKEGIDQTLSLAKERNVTTLVDRKDLHRELDSAKLKALISAYTDLVFQIGQRLKQNADATDLLSKLATVINTLKKDHLNAWRYIWDYEYTEGFAEYASVQSLVDAKIYTLDDKIEFVIGDADNNIAYRTGALGGLYLRNKLKKLPFSQQEDQHQSVWEIVLGEEKIAAAGDLAAILQEHALPSEQLEVEIEAIKEYLVSTVQEIDN